MKKLYILFILIFTVIGSYSEDLKLWYSSPAKNWIEALPIGNSRLGAMVYGGIGHEELQLNEETFWAGGPYDNNNTLARYVLPIVRQLIFEGNYREAQRMVDANFFCKKNGMSYLTMGSLFIDFNGHEKATDFYRDLNISNATATTRYKVDGVTYTRTAFASFTDSVIVMHVKADKKAALNFNVTYAHPLKHKVRIVGNRLSATCFGKEQENVQGSIQAECQVQIVSDGKVDASDKSLQVYGAGEATIYISMATSFVNYRDVTGNPMWRAGKFLDGAVKVSYKKALENHIRYYKSLFSRVTLSLDDKEYKASTKETDIRIRDFNKVDDKSLSVLLFQYGRYLLISSSQPGGQPANLQGIWNDKLLAPWDGKYTININTNNSKDNIIVVRITSNKVTNF